jgi:hypothetical protein
VSSTTDINLISLLVNDDFINYVINPNLILKEMWDDFFSLHPDLIPAAKEAKQILSDKSNDVYSIPPFEMKELEIRIFEKCGLNTLN